MESKRDYKESHEEFLRMSNSHSTALFRTIWASYLHDTQGEVSAINSSFYNLRSKLERKHQNEFDRELDQIAILLDTFSEKNRRLSLLFHENRDRGLAENIHLKKTISELVELLAPAYRSKVNILTSIAPEDLFFRGNKCDFELVVQNILQNAFTAVKKTRNPEIRIEVGETLEGEIESLFLIIEDNGIGIPEGSIDSVFEPFFSTNADGAGLGLTFAKWCIEGGMNGRISISSNYGKGTRIMIIIPKA